MGSPVYSKLESNKLLDVWESICFCFKLLEIKENYLAIFVSRTNYIENLLHVLWPVSLTADNTMALIALISYTFDPFENFIKSVFLFFWERCVNVIRANLWFSNELEAICLKGVSKNANLYLFPNKLLLSLSIVYQ